MHQHRNKIILFRSGPLIGKGVDNVPQQAGFAGPRCTDYQRALVAFQYIEDIEPLQSLPDTVRGNIRIRIHRWGMRGMLNLSAQFLVEVYGAERGRVLYTERVGMLACGGLGRGKIRLQAIAIRHRQVGWSGQA